MLKDSLASELWQDLCLPVCVDQAGTNRFLAQSCCQVCKSWEGEHAGGWDSLLPIFPPLYNLCCFTDTLPLIPVGLLYGLAELRDRVTPSQAMPSWMGGQAGDRLQWQFWHCQNPAGSSRRQAWSWTLQHWVQGLLRWKASGAGWKQAASCENVPQGRAGHPPSPELQCWAHGKGGWGSPSSLPQDPKVPAGPDWNVEVVAYLSRTLIQILASHIIAAQPVEEMKYWLKIPCPKGKGNWCLLLTERVERRQ